MSRYGDAPSDRWPSLLSDPETACHVYGLTVDVARRRSGEEADGFRHLFQGCDAADRMHVQDRLAVRSR